MARGRLITLEGGEGAGKSTQTRALVAALRLRGLAVVATREPGGAPGAEAIRALLVEGEPGRWDGLSEALLHFAARRAHLVDTLRPALDAGRWVVSDRFADSTMAYQGYGHRLGRQAIETLAALTLEGLAPDLTLVLDLPVETGLARAGDRPGAETRYERMDRAFHERVRAGFRDIAEREPGRCVVIDAAAPPERVTAALLRALDVKLGALDVRLGGP